MVQDSKYRSKTSIDKLFKRRGNLHILFEQVAFLENFKNKINEIANFNDEQAKNFHVAELKMQVLTIHTSSATIASQLRLLKPQIIEALNSRKNGLSKGLVKDIKVSVKPNFTKKQHHHEKLRKLSPQNAEILASCAEGIDDPALSAALERLSRNHY